MPLGFASSPGRTSAQVTVLLKFPANLISVGVAVELDQSSLNFASSSVQEVKEECCRDAGENRFKTQHQHGAQPSSKAYLCARLCRCGHASGVRIKLQGSALPRLSEPREARLSVSKMADIIRLGVTATAKSGHRGRFLRGSSRQKLHSSWRLHAAGKWNSETIIAGSLQLGD